MTIFTLRLHLHAISKVVQLIEREKGNCWLMGTEFQFSQMKKFRIGVSQQGENT